MGANFTPIASTLINVEPIQHNCRKVLPLSFDDSLSYYEVICKLTEKINAVIEVLDSIPLEGVFAKVTEVTLKADMWEGDEHPYSQVIEIEGVTENSQVNLTPSVEQLVVFYEKDLSFVTENVGGVVTVYAIGQKPQNDYTVQVTITEVE